MSNTNWYPWAAPSREAFIAKSQKMFGAGTDPDKTVVTICSDCDFETADLTALFEHAKRHGWHVVRMSGPIR